MFTWDEKIMLINYSQIEKLKLLHSFKIQCQKMKGKKNPP